MEQLHILCFCRSLVSRLQEINPRNMKNEEKLAFWINVHNALVMHVKFINLYPGFFMQAISQNSQSIPIILFSVLHRPC
jgi:hypothetical protein